MLSSQPHCQPHCEAGEEESEARCWPQQLVVVSYHRARLSLHSYDLQRKTWAVLASRNLPGWRRKIGATQISGDRLVFPQLNPDSPWKPFSVSIYDVWSDSWTLPPAGELTAVKKERRCEAQSVVSLKDEVFAVLSSGPEGRPVLCGASRLTSPSPIYTMYGPLPGQTLRETEESQRTGEPVTVQRHN